MENKISQQGYVRGYKWSNIGSLIKSVAFKNNVELKIDDHQKDFLKEAYFFTIIGTTKNLDLFKENLSDITGVSL